MSDGDVSVLVVLSDAAWDDYDKGIAEERGDEPRKGDLLICKRIIMLSTPWGPIDERITFRIEELEYAGNIRITIGKPTSLLQTASIVALRTKIEGLALKNQDIDEMEEDSNLENEDEEMKEEPTAAAPSIAPAPSGQTNRGASVDVEMETVVDTVTHILSDAAPTPSLNPRNAQEPGEAEEKAVAGATSPLPTHISPILSRSSAQFQIDTQLQVEATQAQAPLPLARNPIRRSRGGYSMGREGFETTRGDNLTGPQAPTLHQKQGLAPTEPSKVEPKREKLLDLMSKLPGQQPRNRSPEPSAPVSAQQEVTAEEVVIETPAKKKPNTTTFAVEHAVPAPTKKSSHATVPGESKGKRRRLALTSLESRSAPRRVYRIPKDQQALLDHQSSWLPPAPGREFPHPNVPVKLLKLWNDKAELDAQSPSQASPTALMEQSSGAKSVEELQPKLEADESECDSESMSEDEPLEWSQSQPRSQALPPDSSAAPSSSVHTTRLGSRDGKTPTREQAKSLTDDLSVTPKDSREIFTQSGSQRESLKPAAKAVPSTAPPTKPVDTEQGEQRSRTIAEKYANSQNAAHDIVASRPSSSSGQDMNDPGSSSMPQAAPVNSATKAPPSVALPTQPANSEHAELSAKQKARAIAAKYGKKAQITARDVVASQPSSGSRQNVTNPSSSFRPQAAHIRPQIAQQTSPQQNSPLPPTSGANARPVLSQDHRRPVKATVASHPQGHRRPVTTPVASQPIPTGPRYSAPLADNHLGPLQASTQQTAHRPYRAAEPKAVGSFTTPPPGAPTAPRAIRGPRHSVPNPSSSMMNTPDHKSNGHRASTSQLKNGPPPSQASRHDPAGTQMSEMEMSVPRSLPPSEHPSEHRQQRRDYMRDAQRRHW